MFKRKRNRDNGRATVILEKLPELLNVNGNNYDVYTETGDGDVVVYRVEFRKPVKMSGNGYNELIRFLWKVNKDVKLAIIESQENVVCDGCYDLKIDIDRDVADGSTYIKSICFEERP
jgi:hypothetical protein